MAKIKITAPSTMRTGYPTPPMPIGDNRISLNPKQLNVTGTRGNDLFIANQGDYTVEGGGGKDTIDYSAIGQSITIGARGIISKGSAGTDTIRNVQHVIGATGKSNTVDATGANGTSTRMDMDLSQNTMTIADLPGGGSQTFIVDNFTNAIGGSNDDTLKGNDGNNVMSGGDGNDTFIATKGDDTYNVDTPRSKETGIL